MANGGGGRLGKVGLDEGKAGRRDILSRTGMGGTVRWAWWVADGRGCVAVVVAKSEMRSCRGWVRKTGDLEGMGFRFGVAMGLNDLRVSFRGVAMGLGAASLTFMALWSGLEESMVARGAAPKCNTQPTLVEMVPRTISRRWKMV